MIYMPRFFNLVRNCRLQRINYFFFHEMHNSSYCYYCNDYHSDEWNNETMICVFICRWEAVPVHVGRLHMEVCPLRRADAPLPQTHGSEAVPLSPVSALLLPLRPPVVAHETTLIIPLICWCMNNQQETTQYRNSFHQFLSSLLFHWFLNLSCNCFLFFCLILEYCSFSFKLYYYCFFFVLLVLLCITRTISFRRGERGINHRQPVVSFIHSNIFIGS